MQASLGEVLGSDHLDVAKQQNNLALLCRKQGKYDEVEEYYQRALDIYERKLGLDDQCSKDQEVLGLCIPEEGKIQGG